MSAREQADTLVIGAGAAGLAAASDLVSRGQTVTLLEARERAGGRILTERRPQTPAPMELGAEFIHGESKVLLARLKAAGDVAIDASHERWIVREGKLRLADDRGSEFGRIVGRLPVPSPDVSFGEFIDRHRRRIPSAVREMACRMVEGYDAADVTRISARAVLEEWSGPASVSARTFRPARGYDTLVESIRSTLASEGAAQHFGTIVRSIAWKKGHVTVDAERHGEPMRFEARRAIITLPVGVLQLPGASPNAVRFTPELVTKRRSLEYLASGPVIKVVMSFARPFWTELDDGRYRDAAFFFVPQAPFPTFWTTLPLRSSLLVAWCGGSNVARLSASSGDEVIEAVRISLRALFGRRNYSSLLEHVAWHDWQRDPYSCGAYSYVLARGAAARRSLSEPVEGTLFFAGEACDNTGEAATVGGALKSGVRAARQVLEDS